MADEPTSLSGEGLTELLIMLAVFLSAAANAVAYFVFVRPSLRKRKEAEKNKE